MKNRKAKPRVLKAAKADPKTVVHEVMSEADAARACASMFVREGIPEGDEPGEFKIIDVSIDDDGQYFAMIRVPVGNLDVELASIGEHLDQEKLNTIRAEQAD